MTPDMLIHTSASIGLVLLAVAFLLTVYRVIRGPTLPDRVLALDMLVGIVIGFIAVFVIRSGYTLYIDIAISLGLVGFLSTVAFARFILVRGVIGETPETGPAVQAVQDQLAVEKLRRERREKRRRTWTTLSQKETE
ncbi:cation:proton antiporter [Rhizobium paknamense]|uniref:Multicomponent Na+:H+ antiporter subunit F n=1 Tax=Rhizobium paknamense TaxID=1206817 RepID=A0ABU0IAQ1_9HYPH|nr:cation:proton antiporter [Rhizobium paknamense]MDQ0454329.1 multicomponent Na+:H+ antiporter subunit F [Rhizobium paknamense]